MHWPDNSNPENCAWLLNMFKWSDAAPRVPAYLARALPELRKLEASQLGMNAEAAPQMIAPNFTWRGFDAEFGDEGLVRTETYSNVRPQNALC